MKLFEKLKNVLFEEEEIEVPLSAPEVKKVEPVTPRVEERKEVLPQSPRRVQPEEKPIVREIPKKSIPKPKAAPMVEIDEIDEDFIERDIFSPKKTFEFPVFDESDFEDTKKFKRSTAKGETRDKKVNFGRFEEIKPEKKEEVKSFKPSLVISPVYGVLDQNYKKEDIKSKSEVLPKKKGAISIDAVRKKAYGTLEDEIESILPDDDFAEKLDDVEDIDVTSPKKTIDDLLLDSIDESITVQEIEDRFEEDEDEMSEAVKTMDVLSEIEKELDQKKNDKEKLENDTLESDLFNLIDSMYETREDGE